MDGVLVDVTQSYRETIRETVRHFGGPDISHERIQDYKNSGGWNNDWALSQKILADSGIEVPYDTVVREFNRIFFGENNDGLILREQWIADPALLDRLDRRHALCIFTGRLQYEAADHAHPIRPDHQMVHDCRRRRRHEVEARARRTARHHGASIRTCR